MKLSQEICKELNETALKIASVGKGILAADESTGTIGKRFSSIGLENSHPNRKEYRELLFKTKDIGNYISGAILFEETLFDKSSDNVPLVEYLQKAGVVPGIKVDTGLVELMGTDGEQSTQGLDKLHSRCAEYYKMGARFAKWRAVLSIDQAKHKPSQLAIKETAHSLARYASICQENRLVPIVEPEVLADGSHSIEVCAEITEKVLSAVFKALNDHHILLEGCILKPNMVTCGMECPKGSGCEQVGFYTVRTLSRCVPPALISINFLSGGQSEETATNNLNSIALCASKKKLAWNLSFSYGRALQSSTLKTWNGEAKNKEAAQKVFIERCKANSEAQKGEYKGIGEGGMASESLYEKNYIY